MSMVCSEYSTTDPNTEFLSGIKMEQLVKHRQLRFGALFLHKTLVLLLETLLGQNRGVRFCKS